MIRLLARFAFLFLALVVMVWRLLCHDAPLSVVLIALPLLGLALAPKDALGSWIGRGLLVLSALSGAGLWWFHAATSRGEGHLLLLWPLLEQMWCAAGVGLFAFAVGARIRHLPFWWLKVPGLLGFGLMLTLVALPLTKLYRFQVSPRHIDPIFVPGDHFDLTGADGQRLHCRWWSPPSPRGVVVFTHGVGGSFDEFVGVHTLFRREGWAVLDWNLRGHGRSAPAATTYGLREADDLVVVWNEGRRRAAGLPLAAYGASMGAATSLLAAPRLTGCDGMALESSFAELAPLIAPNLRGPLGISARWLARWGLGVEVDAIRPIDALPALRGMPLLFGTAELDRIVPPAQGQQLADAAPWATHIRLAGWGHMDLAYDHRWIDALADVLGRAAAGHGAAAAGR